MFVVGQLMLSALQNNPWMGRLSEVAGNKVIAEHVSKKQGEELSVAECYLFGLQNSKKKSVGLYFCLCGRSGEERGSKGAG